MELILILALFQSLKGFQRLWSEIVFKGWFTKSSFQSLKGFQRLWSLMILLASLEPMVSIPKRVSEALKRWNSINWQGDLHVSIPKRVSEALKPKIFARLSTVFLFQSLKGFQRLWSCKSILSLHGYQAFQSLKGFQRLWSNSVRHTLGSRDLFQSLKGFQRLWSFCLSMSWSY